MTFFKNLMRLIAAALISTALTFGPTLIEFFKGPAPSDIPAGVWAIVGMIAVFLINLGLGLIKRPTS